MNIGFLIPWPLNADLTTYWNLWASIATAIGTFLLAWFAWLAWTSAKATLHGQQNAVEMAALGEYVRALNTMQHLSQSVPAAFLPPPHAQNTPATENAFRVGAYRTYVNSLCNDVEITGLMWRIHHSDLNTLVSEFEISEASLREAQNKRLGLEKSLANRQERLNAKFGGQLKQCALWWQQREFEEKVILVLLDGWHEEFVKLSPAKLMSGRSANPSAAETEDPD
ncbi:hypothetical protein ACT3UQ_08880 [Glutamicibacter sp. AOP12-B1-11]|uniref:hypothetical protein n=1 Tax=Glutamicibacter sp. AOP12-B1-11 TaxID=3457725 RepID=UPI0040337A14